MELITMILGLIPQLQALALCLTYSKGLFESSWKTPAFSSERERSSYGNVPQWKFNIQLQILLKRRAARSCAPTELMVKFSPVLDANIE
jgi:hypothetical protein